MASSFFSFSSVRGVIFDWDGVIADTRLDFAPLREKYFGGRALPLLESAAGMDEPLRSAFLEEIKAEEMLGASRAVPVEGAKELTALLDRRHVPWCVLSRNCHESIDLAALTIGFKLPPATFGREAPHVKPDPQAMRDAAEAMGVAPQHCLVVGDFLYELLGARRAGMRCVLVRRNSPQCAALADGTYPSVTALAQAFARNEELIPWEYQPSAKKWGKRGVALMAERTVHIDCFLNEKRFAVLEGLASCGLGGITVPEGRTLSVDELRSCAALSPRQLSAPLCTVLEEVFSLRYPLMKICGGKEGTSLKELSSPDQLLTENC
ncbi:MAG: HAD family hydrolase [Pyramidobacter sp.]|jgi:HAD superfamily hydrolase (TIGR01509 family)